MGPLVMSHHVARWPLCRFLTDPLTKNIGHHVTPQLHFYIYIHIYLRFMRINVSSFARLWYFSMSHLLHVPRGSLKREIHILSSWAKLNSLREYHPGVERIHGHVKKIKDKAYTYAHICIYICIYIYRSICISAYHRALQEKIHINIPIYLLQESDTAKPCKTLGFSFPNLPISVGFQPPDARPARPGSEVPRQTPLESTSLAITSRLLSSFRTQKHCIKNA